MKYSLVINLFHLLLIVSPLTYQNLYAQKNGSTDKFDTDKLMINSHPRGAYVEISGKYSFIGRTPFVIPYKLYGKYKIKAKKEGYEGISSTVNLAKRGANRITLRLSKKTPLKATYRSLILPGWGQFYGQNTFKGLLVGLTQATLGVITFVAINDYNDAKDDYELALSHFNQVRFNLEDAEIAFAAAQKEFQEAKDAQDFRNTMIYVTAGFWIYNIFDSILFFSKNKRAPNKFLGQTPYFTGQVSYDKIMLSMRVGL